MWQNVEVKNRTCITECCLSKISRHHKCFLQFEEFPFSVQSHCLPIRWQTTFYCWTASKNKLRCVEVRWYLSIFLWSAHTDRGKVCENEHLDIYSVTSLSGAADGSFLHRHTQIYCVHSLCELLQPAFWKQTFSGQWLCLFPLPIHLVCFCLALLVLCVCMHVHMVWVWRRLIKYLHLLLVHNAIMFL